MVDMLKKAPVSNKGKIQEEKNTNERCGRR